MGTYFSVTPSGSGVNGNTLPNTGVVTFAMDTSLEYAYVCPYLYAADANGNELQQAVPPSQGGGNWVYSDSFYLPHSVTINMATFRSAFSHHANLAALKFEVFCTGSSSSDWVNTETFLFPLAPLYSKVGEPTSPRVAATVSRDAVELSWGAGSAGTGNSVTGYDVQYRESSDGSSWGSWTTASGSPVTGTKLNVAPSGTVGNYRQYRVRTRGSAGESWYSGWVTSTNTLRRKWNAFGSWTDATLTAGVSGIRAVHLTQLQERVAVIRAFYGLAAYSFTTVTARKTKIAKWAALIQEIRSAVDGITTSHESWNTLEAGKPRIAHITQLRKIIDGM